MGEKFFKRGFPKKTARMEELIFLFICLFSTIASKMRVKKRKWIYDIKY